MVLITFTINYKPIVPYNSHYQVVKLSLLLIKYKGLEWYNSKYEFVKNLCSFASYFRQPVRYLRKILCCSSSSKKFEIIHKQNYFLVAHLVKKPVLLRYN